MSFSTKIKTNGFCLIEVLIAFFILGFAFLGIAGLVSASYSRSSSVYWRTIALNQFIAINEQLFANDPDCSDWKKQCAKVLPHGVGKCNKTTVSVCWQEKNGATACVK